MFLGDTKIKFIICTDLLLLSEWKTTYLFFHCATQDYDVNKKESQLQNDPPGIRKVVLERWFLASTKRHMGPIQAKWKHVTKVRKFRAWPFQIFSLDIPVVYCQKCSVLSNFEWFQLHFWASFQTSFDRFQLYLHTIIFILISGLVTVDRGRAWASS